jgi:hypothetical protein
MNFRLLSCFVVVSVLAGCAAAPPAVRPPQKARVVNLSGKTIAQVQYQPCGEDENTWLAFYELPLESGKYTEIPLEHLCINLRAMSVDQKEIGRQWEVKNTFPFNWTIR